MMHRVGLLGRSSPLLSQDARHLQASLGEHRAEITPVHDVTRSCLSAFDTLVLGPHLDPRGDALTLRDDVRAWVRGGGSLLLLSSMGGDEAPDGEWASNQVSRGLFRWLSFPDAMLAAPSGHDERGPLFRAVVTFDASPLVDTPCRVSCCRAGLLTIDEAVLMGEGGRVTHAIEAPRHDGEVAIVGARWGVSDLRGDAIFSDGAPVAPWGHVFVRATWGRGQVTACSAYRALVSPDVDLPDNRSFVAGLLALALRRHLPESLRARRRGPQRHRLLHGYPMLPAMQPVDPGQGLAGFERRPALVGSGDGSRVGGLARRRGAAATPPEPAWASAARLVAAERADERGLMVGVLPHPFCNPSVEGCGFCVFSHEAYRRDDAERVANHVADEIVARSRAWPWLRRRRVEGVYFGGATANLTPAAPFERICDALSRAFDLTGAEVTLEGVPVHFETHHARLLDVLRRTLSPRQVRVSMGVQTFDPKTLERMGRTAFGDAALVARVVARAHREGMTASGDLLFDLPGQTSAQMLADVDTAIDMGFDQICAYHLVMHEGLDAPWAHDRSLLAALPSNAAACAHWHALRDRLLARGYVQTTLTNFERADVAASPRRFVYEPGGFRPERNDLVGFGPTGINLLATPDLSAAVKLTNPSASVEYAAAAGEGFAPARWFALDRRDTKILYLTRKIAALGFSRAAYRDLFGADPIDDFSPEFEAIVEHHLLRVTDDACLLTPKGMFFADAVAGLLAQVRLRALAARRPVALQTSPERPAAPLKPLHELDEHGSMG